jgi:hypothetical protein
MPVETKQQTKQWQDIETQSMNPDSYKTDLEDVHEQVYRS